MHPQALYDVLKERRSFNLRDLRPDPVDATSLAHMLDAANWAPSHGHTEPWRFTVFVGEARRWLGEVLAEAYRLLTPAERFDTAVMAFTRDRVLLAPAWISSGAVSRHPHVAQFLGLHPPAQLLGFLYVGTPATAWPTGQRRPMADKVTWVEE